MKVLLSCLIAMLLILTSASAQSPIEIEEIKIPGGIEFIAHNQSDSDIDLTFSLSQVRKVSGYKKAVKEVIPAGKSVKLLKINTSPGYTYKYGLQIVQSRQGASAIASDSDDKHLDKGIVLFHQTTCQRCTYAGNYLVENGTPFTPLDIDDAKNNAILWKKLREQGFTGKGFQTPAIMVDGEISHSHKNIRKFMSQLVGSRR